jgi:hypothetical protein
MMDRRAFFVALSASLAAAPACTRRDADPRAGLLRLLELTPTETVWLATLTEAEQAELYEALVTATPSPRAVQLMVKLLGSRDRLFEYVGYPVLPNRLNGCDGLLRE